MAKIQILFSDKKSWYKDYIGYVVEVDNVFVYDNEFYSLLPTEWNRRDLLEDDFKYLKELGLIVKKSDAKLIEGTVSPSSGSIRERNVLPDNPFTSSAPSVKCDLVLPFDVEEEHSLKSVNVLLDKLENQGAVESINKLIEARKYIDTLKSLNVGNETLWGTMESEMKNNIKKHLEKLGIKGLDIL